MNEINYVGEHIWAGTLGYALVVISFTTALASALAYLIGVYSKNDDWRKIGRSSFYIHAFATISSVVLMLFMLANNFFEYHYIWQHSNSEMETRYIFSAFWEGQEGSTMLWLFWQAILGVILTRTAGKWEKPVMAVVGSAQALLLTMLLGIYVFDHLVGSNPFALLLREHPDFRFLPLFESASYLETLDGRGLNPLLQNYWMTIHPPTLFLGFSATLIPFAYAIAGLWKRDFKGWVKPALPWTIFGVAVFGTGILMGGAWAYESLTFGGFWAWDPVENSSLVPWITLVAALHLMLVVRARGTAVGASLWMTLISFFLVLYSTFLTKSGVLGDSSVHSFTDLGLSGQLVFYLAFYGILILYLMISRYKGYSGKQKEEELWSREFWMFTGALVLFIAAFQIIFTTSNPVWNALFGLELAPRDVAFYNQWQTPFAIIIALLIGLSQWLNYRKTPKEVFVKHTLRDLIISLVLTVVMGLVVDMTNPIHLFLLFASMFAVVGNVSYMVHILRKPNPKVGSSIAHIGFGMILLGALIANGKQEVISANSSRYDLTQLDEDYSNNENILLMLEDTLQMGDYQVAFTGKTKRDIYVDYHVSYMDENGNVEFELAPFIQLNERMGNVAEPATRHYWNKDIFTYVTYAEIDERDTSNVEYTDPESEDLAIGDTMYTSSAIVIFDSLYGVTDTQRLAEFGLNAGDLLVGANLRVYDFDTELHHITTYFGAQELNAFSFAAEIEKIGLKIKLTHIDPVAEEMTFEWQETKNKTKEFIILRAIVFPYINILWMGIILMSIGSIIAMVQRLRMK